MTKMKFFLMLKKKVFKVPEGATLTKVAFVTYAMLFPIQWLRWYLDKEANVRESFWDHSICIHGYRMTQEYFWDVLVPQFKAAGMVPGVESVNAKMG